MKILIIGPFPNPIDGCSNANRVLRENLQKRSIKHSIINTNTAIITSAQGSKFSVKKAVLFLGNYFHIYKVFNSSLVYITPGQTFYGVFKYAPFILMCILCNKPYTIHLHGNYLGRQYISLSGLKKKIFYFLLSNASAGIVITKSLLTNFSSLLAPSKIHVVDYFVEDDLHGAIISKEKDKLRIVYLSNIMNEKGIFELMEALVELNTRQIDYEANIAGSIQEGMKEAFVNTIAKVGGKAKYVGIVTGETKRRLLQEANIFILPTYYRMEGLPFTILEAMATGNIIVTTNHAGIPDVVNTNNGFIIDQRSSTSIVECLMTIDLDLAGMINRFSNFNQSYSRSNFTEESYTNKILSILHGTAKS